MIKEIDYLSINRNSWNNRTETHINSEFYDLDSFLRGRSSLNSIELNLLGEVKQLSILHLQCHFGQDTISLNNLGADVTGVDLSNKSIEHAERIAKELNSTAKFICCDVYDLPNHLNKKYDIVFTSYGTITWLPDLDKWAKIINNYLKPNGKFIFVEFHPLIWMFDDDFEKVKYNYFNTNYIEETESGTYADRDAAISQKYITWNHSMSEVINSLLKTGLQINSLNEYNYSPYNCFRRTIEYEKGRYRIAHLDDKIPMVYSIKATKK